jgi:hypothetical protein
MAQLEGGSMRSQTMGWPERKRKNLIKLGVSKGKAYALAEQGNANG